MCVAHADQETISYNSGMYTGSKMEYVLHLRWGGSLISIQQINLSLNAIQKDYDD